MANDKIAALQIDWLACQESFFYFVIHHCYTQDQKSKDVKLIPDWKYIKEYCDNLQFHKGNIIVLKSRQMLFSWIMCAYALWRILFWQNWSLKLLSKKGENVSDGTPESLFGKIDFIHAHLPAHLKQTLKTTSRPMRIINDNTNSFISGEATTEDAGRGGTFSEVLMDEWAFQENDAAIYSSIVNTTERIVGWSTPNGESGEFFRIWTTEGVGYLKIDVGWQLHPERDEAWYLKKCESMTADQIARELDHSFKGSVADRVFASFEEETHVKEFNAAEILAFVKACKNVGGQDVGYGDGTAYVLGTGYKDAVGERLLYVYKDFYKVEQTPEQVARVELDDLRLYRSPLGYTVWCDPAKNQRKQNGEPPISDDYAKQGLILTNADNDVEKGIVAVELSLKNHKVLIHPGCHSLITALFNSRYNKDRTKYLHDKYSHILDAFRYLVIMFFRKDPNKPSISVSGGVGNTAPQVKEAAMAARLPSRKDMMKLQKRR